MVNPTLRVSLPGFNAGTDTTPDHYALYADQSWVLIKEYARGSASIASNGSITVVHNLGYVPYFATYVLGNFLINGTATTGYIQCSSGGAITVPTYQSYSDTGTFAIINNDSGTRTFIYYVFYDQQV